MSKNTKVCSVEGCGRPALARGWCNMHYLRWKNHGDASYERPSVCSIETCERPVDSRGWCTAHYLRWRRTGNPLGVQAETIRSVTVDHAESCSVANCNLPYYARGLCRRHYDRQRQAGDPTAKDRRGSFDPFSDEFWDQLDMSEGPDACWLWKRGRNAQGYGFVSRERSYIAHRIAWALTHGPIPEGMYILHRCDNPPCCNPAHLFLGTHADNMADMKAKGRGRGGNRPGEHNNHAKLTSAQVAEIKARYPGESQKELAREFDVAPSTISRIIGGKRWV